MKLNTFILIAALVSSRALVSAGSISASGTITGQKNSNVTTNQEVFTISNAQLKTSTIYGIISNAVANAGIYGTGIPSDTVPANGYIAYDPNGFDGMVGGTFYVTNKSGYYYPLSGFDANTNYYSFIEFDTYNNNTNATTGSIDLGFSGGFTGVESEKYNFKTGNGTANITSTALFYAHDNPYTYDAGESLSLLATNETYLQLCGIAQTTLQFTNGGLKTWSIAMNGSGSALLNGNNAIVTGKVTMSPNANANAGGNGGGRNSVITNVSTEGSSGKVPVNNGVTHGTSTNSLINIGGSDTNALINIGRGNTNAVSTNTNSVSNRRHMGT